MQTADFEFELRVELIAQVPELRRESSRLLVLHRSSGQVEHRQFCDVLDYLHRGDLLVLNNSRVIPARLRGQHARTNGQFEVLLLEENARNDWWVMLRPGKRARVGTSMVFRDSDGRPTEVTAVVLEKNDEGHRRLAFSGTTNIADILDCMGEVPLPPYIIRPGPNRMEQDRERYQTVFARHPGSVAAPTAGLHFTESLLTDISAHGVQVCYVTLHVGLGTFSPVKTETICAHIMHEERYEMGEATAQAICKAKSEGRRVIAVGTTTLRVLESIAARVAQDSASPHYPSAVPVVASAGKTRIFIYPPYDFLVANALLTNFHLPRSTLLMLVSAFAEPKGIRGRDMILSAYAEAIRQRYRFFSYGDAMFIV